MSEIHERLVAAFDYLRVRGVVHTQVEFAEAINKSPQQVSDAFKNRPKRCTLGLMKAIATGLGHGGNSVTDIYIDFNMKKVDAANRQILDYVFYGKQR